MQHLPVVNRYAYMTALMALVAVVAAQELHISIGIDLHLVNKAYAHALSFKPVSYTHLTLPTT